MNLNKQEVKRSETDGKRFYLIDGEYYRSTTDLIREKESIYKRASMILWQEELINSAKSPEEAEELINAGALRGRKIHEWIEFYFNHGTWGEESDRIKDYCEPFKSILPKIKPLLIEAPCWHSHWLYAGTADCLGWYENQLTLFDWKTSNKRKTRSQIKHHFLQLAAYIKALEWVYRDNNLQIDRAMLVLAVAGEKELRTWELSKEDVEQYWQEFTKSIQEDA